MNTYRFSQLYNHILKHLDEYNPIPHYGKCGTVYDLAGHAQILSGKQANQETAKRDAKKWLEINENQAAYLFAEDRTFKDIRRFTEGRQDQSRGYDADGYDLDGYDQGGYDRNGYDKCWQNREGYDEEGYDINGFGRDGFDYDGFDEDGFDSDGYHRCGYNRAGYNRDGRNRLGRDADD